MLNVKYTLQTIDIKKINKKIVSTCSKNMSTFSLVL